MLNKPKYKKGGQNPYLEIRDYELFRQIIPHNTDGLPCIEWMQNAPRLHLEKNEREKRVRIACMSFFLALLGVWSALFIIHALGFVFFYSKMNDADKSLLLILAILLPTFFVIWFLADAACVEIWKDYIDYKINLMPHGGYAIYAERRKMQYIWDDGTVMLEYYEHTGEQWKLVLEAQAAQLIRFGVKEQPDHELGERVPWDTEPRFNRLYASLSNGQSWLISSDYNSTAFIRELKATLQYAFIDKPAAEDWRAEPPDDD